MNGFEKAQAEYERYLMAPYDEGGALYDYEYEEEQRQAYLEMQAEIMLDAMREEF